MVSSLTVSFIGSGNLAWHLAPALDNAGFVVREVYSRNPSHASALTEQLYQAEVKATLDFSTSESTVFIIASSDDAIADIAKEIILPENSILVHTSGSQPLDVLQFAASPNAGVLYPLQTFSKGKKVNFKDVPLFIESSNERTEEALLQLARALSPKVKRIGSEQRKALHVAAVFASNFSNHMLMVAKKIAEENDLGFDVLKPLITEMMTKSLTIGPEAAQTGPARRGDLETLDRHLEFLEQHPDWADLYKVISQNIIDRYEPD